MDRLAGKNEGHSVAPGVASRIVALISLNCLCLFWDVAMYLSTALVSCALQLHLTFP